MRRSRDREVHDRNRWLLCLYLLAVATGVRALYSGSDSARDALFSVLPGLIFALLVSADARALGRPLPHSAGHVLFFLWPVSAPAFVMGLRGWRGAGLVLLHTALLSLVYSVSARVTMWMVRGAS